MSRKNYLYSCIFPCAVNIKFVNHFKPIVLIKFVNLFKPIVLLLYTAFGVLNNFSKFNDFKNLVNNGG